MAGSSNALSGNVVLFKTDDGFDGGLVVEEGRKALIVATQDNPRAKVGTGQVVAVEGGSAARQDPVGFMREVRQALADLDVRTAWELVVDSDADSLELPDLLELCADPESAVDRAALLVALEMGETFFKRKGDRYAPVSAKVVAEREEQRARAEAREAQQAEQVDELKRLTDGELDVAALSGDGKAALLAIRQCAVAGEPTPAAGKLLADLLPAEQRPAHVVAFDWLQRIGMFGEHEDLNALRLDWQTAFPAEVEDDARRLAVALPDRLARREPVPQMDLVAIDDAETTEVDDAIGIEPTPDGGCRVHVVICDVAGAVPRDCAVDREAAKRGTTVYHPTMRVLMLPDVLAEGALSLTTGEERLVLDHIFSVDARGQVYDFTVKPARAALSRRLTYEAADAEIEAHPEGDLARIWRVAEGLFNERVEQGAVHFYPPEVKVRVEDGEVTLSNVDNFSTSRRLVSEFMVGCGGAVGRMLAEQMVPAIYRRQVAPAEPIEWDEESAGDPVFILDNVRKLKRAEISLQADRHHALGLMAYCQVTSPLRRYGDLLMQRQLHSFLVRRIAEYADGDLLRLMTAADQTALQVRKAVASAERYWKLVWLSEREGDTVEGIVVMDLPRREQVLLHEVALQTKFFPQRTVHAGETLTLRIKRAVARTDTLVLSEA